MQNGAILDAFKATVDLVKEHNAKESTLDAGITVDEVCRIYLKMAGCDAPICCEAMNAQCGSCKAGTNEEEFCRSSPKMEGCDAKDCSLVRCASEKMCTGKGGSLHQVAGQCCGLCEIKPEVVCGRQHRSLRASDVLRW